MHVGIVAENYYPSLGGIQEHILHLRHFLRSSNVKVTILTGDAARKRGESTVSGPVPADVDEDVIRLGRSWRYGTGGTSTQATISPAVFSRFRRELMHQHFDLLNIHGPCDFGLPFYAHALFKGPRILTLHSCFPDSPGRHVAAPYYRWVFRRSKRVIAVSEATRNSMGRYAQFDADIIPNGVDVRYWASGRPRAPFRQPGFRNILYIGRLEHRNGLDILIDAFSQVAPRICDTRLLIAGAGPLRRTFEKRVPPDLRPRVTFLGAIYDQRPDLYASSSLMVIPARAVGFSIIALESYAAGLPLCAVPALGIGAAGPHWANAIVSPEPTPSSLADTIVKALDGDHRDRIARGIQIAKEHDWSHVGPRILDVFLQTIGEKEDARWAQKRGYG